jgi:hypothetical protein
MPPHLFAMLARSSAGVRCMQRMSVVSTVWDDAFERSVTPLQRRAALLSLVRKIASASWLCLWCISPALCFAWVTHMIALHFCCHVLQAHTASTKRGYVYMLSLFPGFPLRMDELARSADDLSIRGCVVGDYAVDQGGLDVLEVDSKKERGE